jgi:hypothetical protein
VRLETKTAQSYSRLNLICALAVSVVTRPSSGKSVLPARVVVLVAHIAPSVAGLVAVEVVERPFAACRQGSVISIVWVKAVVDVAVEAMMAVEPWSSSKKHSADKPVGPIVAVRSAVERSIVEVSVGADGLHSNADGDLCRPQGGTAEQCNREGRESENFSVRHSLSLLRLEIERHRQVASRV